jgi:hypothetical protein
VVVSLLMGTIVAALGWWYQRAERGALPKEA